MHIPSFKVGDEMMPTRTTGYTDMVNLFRLSELLLSYLYMYIYTYIHIHVYIYIHIHTYTST